MNVKLLFPEDVKEYAMATKRIIELTLEFLKRRYGYVVKELEIKFLRTGNFNFYARPSRVIIEYYDRAFDREPNYCNGIGEKVLLISLFMKSVIMPLASARTRDLLKLFPQ